jgi:RNA polymerase sigma-70 factor (ECF subfamily)
MDTQRSYSDYGDPELVDFTRSGDHKAYDELIRRHSRKLHLSIYQLLGNYEDAFDIAQEAFMKAFNSLATFNGHSSFFTWLRTIAINMARTEFEKRSRMMSFSLDDPDFEGAEVLRDAVRDPSQLSHPSASMELGELSIELNQALMRLSDRHREIVVLHDIQGLEYTEIGKMLNVSEGTIRSRLHYAHKQLQQLLGDLLD